MTARFPLDEEARLSVLASLEILDTPAEPVFDHLAALTARVASTPMAAITLIDCTRQWFKARIGLPLAETPREVAFCAHTILGRDAMVVPDARTDARFMTNPLVIGPPNIAFYAGVPLITHDGYAIGALCAIDVTPRQINDAQLTAMRALARQVGLELSLRRRVLEPALLESGVELVTVLDTDGVIRYQSPSASWLLGYAPEELVARVAFDLVHPEDLPAVQARFQAACGEPDVTQLLEYRFRHGDGSWRVLESVGQNRLHDPSVRGFVIHSRDVTERRRAEAHRGDTDPGQLAESRASAIMELRRAQQHRDDLYGRLVHDLRGPLMTILGNTSLVLESALLEDDDRAALRDVVAAAEELQRMVANVLGIARAESGTLAPRLGPIDLMRFVRDLGRTAESRGLCVEIEPIDGPIDAHGDRELVRSILDNLVDAARRRSRSGATIRVAAAHGGDGWSDVYVLDEGVPLADEEIARVFGAEPAAGHAGPGIGLVFCRLAAEAQGGQVWVESLEPMGARWTLRLPAMPAGSTI